MSDGFKKFKTEFIRNAAIIACVCGLSAGLAACGVVWLALKLAALIIAPWYYVIIGAGVALTVSCALFFVLKPSDKEVAKRLDRTFNLNEKIQTMVEYEGKDGEMLILQREDANERLKRSRKIKPSLAKIIKITLMPIVACAIFLTAAFVPEKQIPPDTSDVYEIDGWQLTALSQLIEDVRKSSLREALKESHATVLEGLSDGLRSTSSQTAMKASVRSAMSMLATATQGANNYAEFAEKLASSGNERVSGFSESYKKGANIYGPGSPLGDFSIVKQREAALYEQVLSVFAESAGELETAIYAFRTFPDFRSGVAAYAQAFGDAVAAMDFAAADDELTRALKVVSDGLDGVIANYDTFGYTLDNLKSQVSKVLADYAEATATEMAVQSYALMMTEYETNKLSSIFGVSVQKPSDPSGTGGNPSENPDDDPGEGGWGGGGVNYGSDDMIFFPDEGIYVSYGEVLNEYYYPKVNELLRDGEMSEEAKRFIREYFNILNRGIRDDADNTEN